MAEQDLFYAVEPRLGVDDFAAVLVASTLGERRPVGRLDVLARMLEQADVIVTARLGGPSGRIVGVSRAITDFAYCTYLSDLAVDQAFQKRGIGKALIQRTHEAAGLHTMMILLAAPAARPYYPHIGMTPHDSAWITPRSPAPATLPPIPKAQ